MAPFYDGIFPGSALSFATISLRSPDMILEFCQLDSSIVLERQIFWQRSRNCEQSNNYYGVAGLSCSLGVDVPVAFGTSAVRIRPSPPSHYGWTPTPSKRRSGSDYFRAGIFWKLDVTVNSHVQVQ